MKKITTLFLLMFISGLLIGQSIGGSLEYYDKDDARLFLQPLANTIGAGINSGSYNTAKVLRPFMPYLKLSMVLVPIPDNDKTFIAKPPTIAENIWGGVETATIFGHKGGRHPGLETDIPGTYYGSAPYTLPDGANMNTIPIPCASISLGLPFGNEIMIRALPPISLPDDLGKIGMWGVGWKHSIDQYLPHLFPVHLSVQGVYQSIEIADIIDISAFAINAHASKNLLMLTVYGGFGYEKTTIDVEYTYMEKNNPADPDEKTPRQYTLDFEASNHFSTTVGARWSLGLIDFFADYTVSNYNSINFGIGIGF
jgi:hypothetical protein